MKAVSANLENRTEFLGEIGPQIASQMTKALQGLTAEEIKVEFGGVQAFEDDKVFVNVEEKCFGSFVNFRSPEAQLDGVVVLFFPLSSAEVLTRLLLKRYLDNREEKTDSKMKLSAFREATHILLANYIAVIANALAIKFQTSVPRFVRFHNFEFLRPGFLDGRSGSGGSACTGQFGITGTGDGSVIHGLFISAF